MVKSPNSRPALLLFFFWCDEHGYGAKAETARELGVKRQAVTDWFGERQEPTGEQVLAIIEFLRKRRRRK